MDWLINKVKCCLFGHDYEILRRLSDKVHQIVCLRCRKIWLVHADHGRMPWNEDIEKDMASIYNVGPTPKVIIWKD